MEPWSHGATERDTETHEDLLTHGIGGFHSETGWVQALTDYHCCQIRIGTGPSCSLWVVLYPDTPTGRA